VLHARNVALCHVLPIFNKPLQSLLERRKLVDQLGLKGENGVQRDQANEGPNGKLLCPRVAIRDGVVIEST
jgi:hypothetical protein